MILMFIGRHAPHREPQNEGSSANSVHEPDFHFFSSLDGLTGLFLDVGANTGQSAISFFAMNRTMNVLSLEPNPSLEENLDAVSRQYPGRFDYRIVGASDANGETELMVPRAGRTMLTDRASIVRGEFEKPWVGQQIREILTAAGETQDVLYERVPIRLVTIDSLAVRPLVIKIDVEGHECSVLKGAERTLDECHPILLIENNNLETLFPYLLERGYEPFMYNFPARPFVHVSWRDGRWLNSFWFHPETPHTVAKRIRELVPPGTLKR